MRAYDKPVWISLLLIGASSCAFAASSADEGPPGLTTPGQLRPFDPNAPACHAPSGRTRVLAYAPENTRKFLQGVGYGLGLAAHDRGLQYRVAVADSDASKQTTQIQAFAAAKVGAIVVAPVDSASLAPSLKEVIWDGGYVGSVVPPPATEILNAPQYLTGKTLGDAAAAYIRNHLAGKADIVLLTQDSLEFLAPRFVAIRDSLRDIPGATIVADISPSPVNEEGGFATMKTVLEAHPDVDVVLGADTVVLGALRALRDAGKARQDQFLGGLDGEPEAVAEVKRGGPYKASVALSSPVFGYALGEHAADWLEGRSVPQAMDILPIALTIDNISHYESDLADPAAVYADPARRSTYLSMYGNICYDTRDQYLNYPWSSELK